MNKRQTTAPIAEVRLIGINELASYLGIGRNSAIRFGEESGAVRRIGRRTLYDRRIIDRAIDQLEAN